MNNPETIIRGIIKEAVMTSSGVPGDYEGDMARGELQAIIANAQDLLSQIEEKTELEAWVQSKITKAADYISSVRNYMQGQQHRMQSSGMHDQLVAEEKEDKGLKEACWSGYIAKGTKKKGGRTVPNCVPMEEQSNKLDETSSKFAQSYIKAAKKDVSSTISNYLNSTTPGTDLDRMATRLSKRTEGIATANRKLDTAKDSIAIKEESQKLDEKSEAWQRKEGKDPEGGLNAKGVASYRRANPGSKLQTAVTTEPSKLAPGSKKAKRRKSFCSRMKGMKAKLTSAKTARDPDSRINKSLRKWNCE